MANVLIETEMTDAYKNFINTLDSEVSNTLLDNSCIRPRSPGKLHRTEFMQCHAFRKYFETTSKLAGMDSLLIDRCMGHKTGLKDSYTKLNDYQILEGSRMKFNS
jgi:hypothetical protein